MIMEKVLIHNDTAAAGDFQRSVENAMRRCNALIENFELFQPWQKITTTDLWVELASDPEKMFDEVLLANTELKAKGRKPDPVALAQIFDINRDGFLDSIKSAISKSDYDDYSAYLSFNGGNFVLNNETIKTHLEGFKTYAVTPQQITILNHWQGICEILNKHAQKGYIGLSVLEQAGKLFGLRYVGSEGKLFLNEENLLSEILKSK